MQTTNPPGPRERRRTRTKLTVQTEALKLFAHKGYDQTTVDDIAQAADISPRTFFRYFPTKEDVVLWDEYDDLTLADMWALAEGDRPLTHLVSSLRAMMVDLYTKDPDLLLTRFELSFQVPEIRARFSDRMFTVMGPYYNEVAETLGVEPDDLRLPVILAGLFGAMMIAVERWQRSGGRKDLIKLFDDAVTILAAGAPELGPWPPAAPGVRAAAPRRPRH